MTDTTPRTDEQVDAAVRQWAHGAYDAEVAADIILNSTAREYVVNGYLDWSDDGLYARPALDRLLADADSPEERTYLSGSGEVLVRIAANVIGQGSVNLRDMWKLDPSNRRVLLRALEAGLTPH